MNIPRNFKKPLLITFAVIIGAGAIFNAVKGDTLTGRKLSVNNPNDNWQDSLRVIPPLDATSTLAVQRGLHVAENISSGEAVSETDLLSRKIFASYVSVRQNMASGTPLTDDQAAGIAKELTKEALQSAPSGDATTIYSLKDIKVSSDNSATAFITYTTTLNKTLSAFTALNTQEIPIISDALNTKDEQKVAGLLDIIAAYKKLETDLLAIKTPSGLTSLHLRLVQGYANVRGSITVMHDSFNDPAAILNAFSQYKNAMADISTIASEYSTAWPIKQ